jgi:hypothetical protein
MRDDDEILKIYSQGRYELLDVWEKVRLIKLKCKDEMMRSE